jgi:alkyldihydroxyacetonephosphate synthase
LSKAQREDRRIRRKFHGWGFEGEELTAEEVAGLEARWLPFFGFDASPDVLPPPRLDGLRLRPSRLAPPAALAHLLHNDAHARAFHAYGRAFPESVRIWAGDFADAPDWVAYPESADDVAALLAWCGDADAVGVPFGGGTSVAGGAAPPPGGPRPAVTIDLSRLSRVLEVDRISLSARIQAGVRGPELEAQLKPHGLTLRHYMQSFEFSTLGGWIATRSAGHFATLFTHIDDMVQGMEVVAPCGERIATRRLPASGAGPQPERLFLGSEGTLGVITEAWVRLHRPPGRRGGFVARFRDFPSGAEAVRAIVQSGLLPANLRLLDEAEAGASGAETGGDCLLLIGFESPELDVAGDVAAAEEICRAAGAGGIELSGARGGSAGAWRSSFFRLPYYREFFLPRGIISDTFESAVTWDQLPAFHAAVMRATRAAIRDVTGREGWVGCRLTHVYRDGPAPYFTIRARGRHGEMSEQHAAIKAAAMEAVLAHGGTTTHHHAVGRLHRPWYERERPAAFGTALAAAKRALDPRGLLNPGVLLDPEPEPTTTKRQTGRNDA